MQEKAEDLIPAGVVAQADLYVGGWIKFVMIFLSTLWCTEAVRGHERRNGLRPGDRYGNKDEGNSK